MNVKLFKSVASKMLQKHFGVDLKETHFNNDIVVQREIAYNVRPFTALNEYAEDHALLRIDLKAPNNTGKKAQLTLVDEIAALAGIAPLYTFGEDPVVCVKCGTRTQFDLLRNGRQIHKCTRRSCGHEFIAEEDMEDVAC